MTVLNGVNQAVMGTPFRQQPSAHKGVVAAKIALFHLHNVLMGGVLDAVESLCVAGVSGL